MLTGAVPRSALMWWHGSELGDSYGASCMAWWLMESLVVSLHSGQGLLLCTEGLCAAFSFVVDEMTHDDDGRHLILQKTIYNEYFFFRGRILDRHYTSGFAYGH